MKLILGLGCEVREISNARIEFFMKAVLDIDINAFAEEVVLKIVKAISPLIARNHEELLTVNELCQYLRVKPQWIYKRVQYKEIPYIKASHFLRFKKSEIDRWLTDQGVPATRPLSAPLKAVK